MKMTVSGKVSLARCGLDMKTVGELLMIRSMMAVGLITHNPKPTHVQNTELVKPTLNEGRMRFNMAVDGRNADCGTVGCIAGWQGMLTGRHPNTVLHNATGKMHWLYHPEIPPEITSKYAVARGWVWQQLTVKHAIAAIDILLNTGKVDWMKAVGGRKAMERLAAKARRAHDRR